MKPTARPICEWIVSAGTWWSIRVGMTCWRIRPQTPLAITPRKRTIVRALSDPPQRNPL